jgi:hypothetical protein
MEVAGEATVQVQLEAFHKLDVTLDEIMAARLLYVCGDSS